MGKLIYSGCIGNGKLKELEVIQLKSGRVRMMLAAGGCYGQIFEGSIEEARAEYKRLKKEN